MNYSIGKVIFKRYGLRLFGIVIAILIYFNIDNRLIIEILKSSDIEYFVITIFLVNSVVILQAARGYILLGDERCKLSFYAYLHSYFVTMAASAVMPGRFGALAQVPLLRQNGVSGVAGIANVIYDKFFDLFGFLTFGAIFSTFYISRDISINPVYMALMSILALSIIWNIDTILSFIGKYTKKVCPAIRENWLSKEIKLSLRIKVYAILITLIRILGAIAVHWSCSFAIGVNFSFLLISIATIYSALSTLIPISIMGVGVREGIFLIVLGGHSVPDEEILVFAFLILLSYLSTAVIGMFLALLGKRHISFN